MKNLPWKKIALGTGLIAIAIAGIFYFSSSLGNKPIPVLINPAFGEYISSYTAGVLPSSSPLRIVFSRDVVDSTEVGQTNSVKLFDFSPSIQGKTFWIDKRTIEFKPEDRLISGKRYEAKFMLSRLFTSLPKELAAFEYSFQITPQNFEVYIQNIKPYLKADLKKQKIEGILNTADYAESALVEKTVEAVQEGKTLKVTWTHTGDGLQHGFTVEDVMRNDAAGKVNISVNGQAFGIDRTENEVVDIPSIDDFKLIHTRVVETPNQHLVLQFSDPLKENQNLTGLIRISDLADLDFDIHDNEIWVYPPVRQSGSKTVSVETGIKNVFDRKLKVSFSAEIAFEQLKPAVKFTGNGSILPSTNGLVLPFEAVNLVTVDVQVTKIFENNILQFLQVNNIAGDYQLNRVGTRILTKKIQLANTGITDLAKWNRYTLDVSKLINAEPGAIYQIKLSFKKAYSNFYCEDSQQDQESISDFEPDESSGNGYDEADGYEDYEEYYYGRDYEWEQRDNPCHSSYYTNNRAVTKNILASDLGLTIKRGGDGNTFVFVTDLKTATPKPGVDVALYSYQMQLLGTASTDADGKVVMNTKVPPFAAVAKNGAERGYLRLANGEALALSNFDVSGEIIQKGLKGFLYGDRGVWRPGDSLFLTFILEDKRKLLPSNHPVVFELNNPQGQVVHRIVRASSENGFYNFNTSTSPDAPTGNWMGRVKVGDTDFAQAIKIETVKPNRLKINLDFGTEKFISNNVTGNLEVKWLHGAPGRNLKAEFEVMLLRVPTQFNKYPEYQFDDPSRQFNSESQTAFEGFTDAEGKAVVNVSLETGDKAPGFLNAVFRGKVYEESGNFSIDRFSLPYYPYSTFIGMRTPKGERYTDILYTDTTHRVDIVSVDTEGNNVSRNGIEIKMYKLNWRWWWDNTNENLANFVEGSHTTLAKSGTIKTSNGKGFWTFNVKASEYGGYFIRACDPVSGHCTGQKIFVDEPGWYSRARGSESRGGATMLSFSTDKTQYSIGEKINLTIPGSSKGRALISVENGSKVLKTYWLETKQGDNIMTMDAVPEMAPNVYVHVSLMQTHDQTVNDLPLRMYGVSAIKVEDPETHLSPLLSMPDALQPGEEVVIKVSEKSNRKMTYTVAVVDEGLLDLTKFKTPDAWSKFYAREALGVRTWDLYDYVMGAFGTKFERLVSIGGDGDISPKDEDPRANRFKPVVKFFGPYTLDGGTDNLKFIMPEYIGSVKTMLVAGYEGAYGKTEKVTAVRKPLMVLATLPRVLGPAENVKLPVTLFTSEKNLRNVKVQINIKGPVTISGEKSKIIDMSRNADVTVDFDLQVKSEIGMASIEVLASSGNLRSRDVIEIEVRNPNLPVTRVEQILLEEGKSWSAKIVPFGIAGTNTASFEVSTLPPINLGSRLRYLLQYPHGCIEQTTSSVFPQLYMEHVKVLSADEKQTIQKNINAGIERLRSFVQPDGGFGYWPGAAEYSDPWGTSYAGHFLIEAEAKGYFVPAQLVKRWKKFQQNKALEWRRNEIYHNSDLMQAYRLYSLALAGVPELGAMNRLREEGKLNATAAWMLASAFAKVGQVEAAKKMISDLPVIIKPYRELGYSYGSDLRDKALILETLVLLNEKLKAFEILKEISGSLGDHGYWMSTQEIAMCLKAVGNFAGMEKRGDLKFRYRISSGKTISASTTLPLAAVQIPVNGILGENLFIESESKGVLFARLITVGTPAQGQEEAAASNLNMSVRYTDSNGTDINPTLLEQGTEFIVEVKVSHSGMRSGYENLALSQVFPSGWEINNLRLEEAEQFLKSSDFNYQDVRDDRVFTYFNLSPNQHKTFRTMLTATYAGNYYLPAVSCEAMYDNTIYARQKGQPVEVIKAKAK